MNTHNGNVYAYAQNESESNKKNHVFALRKNKTSINAISRSEALRTLEVFVGSNVSEIRSNYKILARKCHPDKWCDRSVFTRKEGENIFKNASNEYQLLR